MDNFYPEYRVYRARSEFRGTDVFEIFAGEMADKVTFWNQGSVYVREQGFEPFARMMQRVLPHFEWYDFNRLNQHQARQLLKLLDHAANTITAAKSSGDLLQVDYRILVTAENFTVRKAQLTRMVADLSAVVETAVRRRCSLWVLGL